MDTQAFADFLQQNILSQKIVEIKKFGKGQMPVFGLKLDNGQKLTIKFYSTQEDCLESYEIAQMLGKNPDLRVPRLYEIPHRFFVYENMYGLCFFYVEGRELGRSKISSANFKEIAAQFAVLQQTKIENPDKLRKDFTPETYIKTIKEKLAATQAPATGLSRLYYKIALHLAAEFVSAIEKSHQTPANIPYKLIHHDVTKSNLLFLNGHFQSFIDTDSVRLGYAGRDFAEFIISTMMRYPFYKSKRQSIARWYRIIDEQFKLPLDEYVCGLDVYYLYRLNKRLDALQNKISVCKLYDFWEFLHLRKIIVKILQQITSEH